jgi:adenylate cyclase
LGGEVRDVTVMFVDIANFTPLSEKLKPDELVQVVNGLWDVCSDAVLAENGTIDKFIGDAIMAFWNAPLPCEAHQKRAAQAALRIRKAVQAYNQHLPTKTLLMERGAWPISMRAGMASGPACVGNVGSKDRFDYTVLGETVNIAARAEGAGKQVEHDIVVAGKLAAETTGLALLHAGFVKLKGKTAREPLHIVVGDETEALSESFLKLAREHDQLVNLLKGPTALKNQLVASQLLNELAIHHQQLEKFMKALPDRIVDFEMD